VVSNLSTIGFVFADDQSFTDTMQRLSADAFERLACGPGDYAIWRSRTGAEVWFHVTGTRDDQGQLRDREIIGLTPFFEGLSDVAIEVTEAITRPGESEFEGAFHAWVDPDAETGTGSHQIVFDAVDFAAHCDREMPFLARGKLSGFAREIRVLSADDETAAARADSTARSFMAIGLFTAKGQTGRDSPPSSNALLTGQVVERAEFVNEETGAPFHWLLVRCADQTFDILADPDVVTDDIPVGAIVEVATLFFGRIIG
jgi:hypothetical protein